MFSWLRKLFGIVAAYDREKTSLEERMKYLQARVNCAEELIRDRTDIGVDMEFNPNNGANHIIVVGQYKGIDYVQSYCVDSRDFSHFVDILRGMRRYGSVKYVDAIPQFRAVIKREVL